jgi:hypothetical protein
MREALNSADCHVGALNSAHSTSFGGRSIQPATTAFTGLACDGGDDVADDEDEEGRVGSSTGAGSPTSPRRAHMVSRKGYEARFGSAVVSSSSPPLALDGDDEDEPEE